MPQDMTDELFEYLVDDPDRPGGLSETAQGHEPGSFLRHVVSLSGSKIADGLIDPKLVLSWLLTSLGAGAFWTGLLVPVRESLALLPQLFTSPVITGQAVRKWFWAGGAVMQGICAILIGIAGLTLDGATAGAVIVGLLAVLALARSVCSASYKDILGKTVGSSRRGTATGTASSAASVAVIAFALLLLFDIGDRMTLVIGALFLAGGFWIASGALFATLKEQSSTGDGKRAIGLDQFALLRQDPQLVRFIAVRSLLVGTALAPPYFVVLAPDSGFSTLGALVLASAVAALLSSYVWGRLSDRSSRRVLIYAGVAGGAVLSVVAVLGSIGGIGVPLVLPAVLFVLMIAYHGVRQGRSTHLVDMADEHDRTPYTALSNTIVGVVLFVAGAVFAAIAAWSVTLVIALFAVMCWAAAALALGLKEVQNDA
ncbi:MFS transporter [Loktanella sp. SALINAS62]|uniref:MFS transporter n=1 Tax=Loktanella sp. SALINAS62 TaxID=2706124 RepID=UPI001B8AE593|nr:MFS transporter [Loktanella sp. SALINAS62]MBS1303943.1 MFS transporter [Loktanella sp. SALINAS62]